MENELNDYDYMNEYQQYLIKLSIGLAAVYLFYHFFLRKLTFYQWNRWYLTGYIMACFFIPFFNIYSWVQPGKHESVVLEFIPAVNNIGTAINGETNTKGYPDSHYILLLITAGIFVMLLRLLIQYVSLLKMARTANLVVKDTVKLFEVSGTVMPFSFGNSIFINPALHNEDELKEIIRHEMVHVKERHTVDMVISELLVAFNWYNPFAWLLRSAIRQNLEFIADQHVLENGINRQQYQYLLLKVIGQRNYSLANYLNFSSLKTRIMMMNKLRSARVHLVKFAFAIPIMAVLLLAFRNQQTIKDKDLLVIQKDFPVAGFFAVDTVPNKDQQPGKDRVNTKGYLLSIADNEGECVVIVKDRNRKIVKAVLLTEWDANASYEQLYGEIPPPSPKLIAPVPPLPPEPPAPLKPSAPAAPVKTQVPKNSKVLPVAPAPAKTEVPKNSIILPAAPVDAVTPVVPAFDPFAAFEKKDC